MLPIEICEKLIAIDDQYKANHIGLKSCCKQRWSLVKQYVTRDIRSQIKRIRKAIARKQMDEKNGYSQVYDLLKLDNIYLVDEPTTEPTENFSRFSSNNNNILEVPKMVIPPKENVSVQIAKKPKSPIPQTSNFRSDKRCISPKPKRVKLSSLKDTDENKSSLNNNSIPPDLSDRCLICHQYLTNPNILLYNGHPKDAVEETIALTDPKLLLFTGEENEIDKLDQLPLNKITNFSVYDKNGHLCPFDTGLIEKNVMLYFSGYIKPIYDEDPSPENGIPVKDLGPIQAWWISGFDGGKYPIAGLSTIYAEYYLMQPSEKYEPVMKPIQDKFYLSKVVIEYLIGYGFEEQTYEDLLNHLYNWIPPDGINHLSEEILLNHAGFVCHQVANLSPTDDNENDEFLFLSLPCIQSLINLAGVDFAERKLMRKLDEKKNDTFEQQSFINTTEKVDKWDKKKNICKSTTTPLVQQIFDSFENFQKLEKDKENKRTFCGNCISCQLPACENCTSCQSNKRKSGKNEIQEICLKRRCLQIEEVISDSESDLGSVVSSKNNNLNSIKKRAIFPVAWNSLHTIQPNSILVYYNSAIIDNKFEVKCGDFVLLRSEKQEQPFVIAKIGYMFNSPEKMFHAIVYRRGTETILGEVANPMEIFAGNECENCPLGAVIRKVLVHQKFGNDEIKIEDLYKLENDNSTFFCHKSYNRKLARFEDLKLNEAKDNYYCCEVCVQKEISKSFETPTLQDEDSIIWRDEIYKVGTAVYLVPDAFRFKTGAVDVEGNKKIKTPDVDEEIFPEFYRKKADAKIKDNNVAPFCIGYIVKIIPTQLGNLKKNMLIRVQKLYRPENTHKSSSLTKKLDINLLYWSLEQETINFNKVVGKCYLAYSEILEMPASKWSLLGPDRFYFSETYDLKTQEFLPVESPVNLIGRPEKSSKKSKRSTAKKIDKPKLWPTLKNPLKTLDCFAGCGGLSEGLHQSGLSETKWAIEIDKAAAKAFELNNPEAIIHTSECNKILDSKIAEKPRSSTGLTLPVKGEVDLLIGGPPCQGFSGMNRFNSGQHSLSMNFLVVTYLSYCDYYRPKYFVLENVRNFASFKKGIMLKLTLRCLLAMGYQCTFGILQAGNFGVPQARRRLIILAAAPGESLPEYPEPTHVMNKQLLRATELDIILDGCRYNTGSKWQTIGAPYRTITVRDAMSDLPKIPNGYKIENHVYDSIALSQFQRLMRESNDNILRDHICKEMLPIVVARMSYIPTAPGSDWRDLPNIVVCLSDGTFTNKLRYEFDDKKNGRNSNGARRGVCPCANKKPCDQSVRQMNTLIPWCLPHTANRHNQWTGLYGRLDWDGIFPTTVTNPEPMAKQGRVIHPDQYRVVSVRECARSQGFSDKYKFYGNTLDKYKQIGNAVPPPLGVVIGRKIIEAILKSDKNIEQFD